MQLGLRPLKPMPQVNGREFRFQDDPSDWEAISYIERATTKCFRII